MDIVSELKRKGERFKREKEKAHIKIKDGDPESSINIKVKKKAKRIEDTVSGYGGVPAPYEGESWIHNIVRYIVGEELTMMLELRVRKTKKNKVSIKGIKFKLKGIIEEEKERNLRSIKKSWGNGLNATSLKNNVGKVREQIMADDICGNTIIKIAVEADVGSNWDICRPEHNWSLNWFMDDATGISLVSCGDKIEMDGSFKRNQATKDTKKVRLKDEEDVDVEPERNEFYQFGGRVETFERYGLSMAGLNNTVEKSEVQIMGKDACCGNINATVIASVGTSLDNSRPNHSCTSCMLRDSIMEEGLSGHGNQKLGEVDKLRISGCEGKEEVKWGLRKVKEKEKEWLFRRWTHWGEKGLSAETLDMNGFMQEAKFEQGDWGFQCWKEEKRDGFEN
jgi:hypothetical protein